MPDSAIVHYSGDWVFHNGAVAPGALLSVFDSGTSNLASIFTDSALTTPSANPITADASGLLPFAWIGTSAYKVRLTTSGATLIDEQDVVPGALDTAPFLAGDFAKPDQDFNAKTGNYTVVSDDLGTILNGDCSGGAFDFTLISAVTATNGKGVTLRHVGTANTIGIVTVSSQTITSPTTGVTTTAFELIGYGESVTLESDGSNWHVTRYVPPLLRPNTPGVILIASRITVGPASSPGTRYILAAPLGSSEQEDIIEDNGQGGFIEITPPTDCGWLAYVQDEDRYYAFIGSAWVLTALQNINNFTEDTTPDETADFVVTYDASASDHKKVKPTNFTMAGGLQLLNSGTVSAAATLDIVLTGFTTYRGLKLVLSNFVPATDDVELWLRVSTDGGSTFDAGAGNYRYAYLNVDEGAVSVLGSSGDTKIRIAGDTTASRSVSNIAAEGGATAEIDIFDQTATGIRPRILARSGWIAADNTSQLAQVHGQRLAAQDTDALRILFEGGNIASGNWALYGYA